MFDIAISIGHRSVRRNGPSTLREVLAPEARSSARKALDFARGRQIIQGDEIEQFWALNNVSLDVARGEVIGIIGPNGAGKSTPLKILSRITDSTTGRVRLRGRVASPLDVGTGFHPELSGRENIYLNGGKYWVSETIDTCPDCVSFEIEQSPISNRTFPHTPDHGFVVPRCRYEALAPELSV
jgi:ABC-type polysaccharide/polyol phosphate transport system ATPase subunit